MHYFLMDSHKIVIYFIYIYMLQLSCLILVVCLIFGCFETSKQNDDSFQRPNHPAINQKILKFSYMVRDYR